ncbi:MAG: AAA family ATPase [Litorilinea sp.]
MRNPYYVGGWVRGRNHYGRHFLIESLLAARDAATWVVGTRRLGKTSLLRQMEYVANARRAAADAANAAGLNGDGAHPANGEDTLFVPIYLDLQGCESPADLAYELELALDDRRRELTELGIELDDLPNDNAVAVLRSLARAVRARGARLLLLLDEAEALLTVAAQDARWLGTLRKALLEGHIRTVMTSTRLLSRLNHLHAGWDTSPFLFGFQMVNLWALGGEAGTALIRQTQAEPVEVDGRVLAQIFTYCNGHPYLIQYLCERLFVDGNDGRGALRAITDADLEVDHLLAGFFFIEFRNMTRVERRVLLTLSTLTLASEPELLSALYDIPPARVRMFLYALSRLGYVRSVKSQWAIGNEFLRRWLLECEDELCSSLDSSLDDEEEEQHLRDGARDEVARLRQKIGEVETELAALQKAWKKAVGNERTQLADRIVALREELARLQSALTRAIEASTRIDDP